MEDPSAVIEAHRKRVEEMNGERLELEPRATSLTLLQQVYRNPKLPLPVRTRAAGMALPFEHPKLGISVNVGWSEEMAKRLEQAIARSAQVMKVIEPPPPQIEHQPEHSAPEQSPLSTVIGPVPDRRYRRA